MKHEIYKRTSDFVFDKYCSLNTNPIEHCFSFWYIENSVATQKKILFN